MDKNIVDLHSETYNKDTLIKACVLKNIAELIFYTIYNDQLSI